MNQLFGLQHRGGQTPCEPPVSPAAQRDKIKRGAYRNTFLLKVLVVSMEIPIFATWLNKR